jgi:capsular exopolysaccharide synthesis family protein
MASAPDDDPQMGRVRFPPAPPRQFNLDQFPREGGESRLTDGPAGPAQRTNITAAPPRSVAEAAARGDGRVGREARVDQYTRLAAVLNEAQATLRLKTLMVTSTQQGEGKTAAVVCLAHVLGATYARRVLVIDANLRRPSLHEALGVRNDVGLSDALGAGASVRLPIIELSPLLHILPCGAPAPDPVRALASDRMRAVLDQCADQFDWVLLDTPPLSVGLDVQVLARTSGRVVFVIGAASVPFPAVERAIAALGRESIVGTVLNGVQQGEATLNSLHVTADMAAAALSDRTLSGIDVMANSSRQSKTIPASV